MPRRAQSANSSHHQLGVEVDPELGGDGRADGDARPAHLGVLDAPAAQQLLERGLARRVRHEAGTRACPRSRTRAPPTTAFGAKVGERGRHHLVDADDVGLDHLRPTCRWWSRGGGAAARPRWRRRSASIPPSSATACSTSAAHDAGTRTSTVMAVPAARFVDRVGELARRGRAENTTRAVLHAPLPARRRDRCPPTRRRRGRGAMVLPLQLRCCRAHRPRSQAVAFAASSARSAPGGRPS